MKNLMKRIIVLAVILSCFQLTTHAQPDINFLDKKGYFKLGGGMVFPGHEFSGLLENGLFAKNGYQFGFDFNYIIAYGFGVGANLEFNGFGFNRQAFFNYSQADRMEAQGGYTSSKFGLNLLFNVPVLFGSENFVLNFYGEGNAGLRGIAIPAIDLYYNELVNKYVEVSYRSRASTMGYLGYSGGIQMLFNQKFGINLSYNEVLRSRHSIKYSVRKMDALGELYEAESYIHDYLDNKGFQIAFLFLLGK